MSIFTMALGEQFLKAAGIAWLCFAWGILVMRVHGKSPHGQALARVLILFAPGILTLFGYHSVRQYNVVLAQNRVPFSEVADNGGRTIVTGIDFVDIDGYGRIEWSRVSAGPGYQTHRAMLSGSAASEGADRSLAGNSCCLGGCCGCLGTLSCECSVGTSKSYCSSIGLLKSLGNVLDNFSIELTELSDCETCQQPDTLKAE
jgi:hypothetical protein